MLTYITSLGHTKINDLKEMYTSIMLRSLAISMSGIFIPIFLYQLDYLVWQILFYYCIAFTTQYVVSIPVAKLVANIGPKHTIAISYLLQIFTMLSLIIVRSHPKMFVVSAALLGLGNIVFFMAYHIDFSKVKHKKTGGSELGRAYLGERIGAVIGPFIGGLVAFMFGAKYIFLLAVAVLLGAMIPLLISREPTRLKQKLNYKDFDIKSATFDISSYGFFAIEAAVSMIVWPFFLGVYILTDSPYIKLGIIMSVSIVISVAAAKLYGKIIDKTGGRSLLRYTSIGNAILHIIRVFTPGYWGAFVINLFNEIVTPGYRLGVFKGMYSAADDHPGHRIVYISIVELIASFARAVFFAIAAIFAYYLGDSKGLFGLLFIMGSLASLLIMTEKFKVLDYPKTKISKGLAK